MLTSNNTQAAEASVQASQQLIESQALVNELYA